MVLELRDITHVNTPMATEAHGKTRTLHTCFHVSSVCFRGDSVVIHKETNSPQSRKERKVLDCFVKEFLCVLCVFAVKTVFMDG
jgi:hypothetical protein